jgi:chorismate mutase
MSLQERQQVIKQFFTRKNPLPLVVAGPCSAESEEQIMATARQLAKMDRVHVFRAGIWKPRTRPNQFEGIGNKGLEWLSKVKKETGLPVATEIAKPEHVDLAVKYDLDMVWLGARTVVNPFSVQELSQALRGTQLPVMIKNPVTPDINLWIGAIERIANAGIKKIAAIHRGFYFFEKSPYRNAPMWEIPIELQRNYPELPMICDPSHIAGKPDYLKEIAQKGLDLAMDGIMIETHWQPKKALTDAMQQITPKFLHELLDGLTLRQVAGNEAFQNQLALLRSEIDKLDTELFHVLSKRFQIIREIGAYKKENNITVLQLKRWTEILNQRTDFGERQGMNREFLTKILKQIHKESIRIQTDILNKEE